MSTDDNTPDTPDQTSRAPGAGERIAKVLSRRGVASRRDAERLILEGRVAVNGQAVTTPATNVTDRDRIEVDGQPVEEAEPTRLWLYHKPAGLVTTEHDEEGRPTVFESLPDDMPRVMSIGRLDLTSEGLLLLTNDGEVKRRLELPSTGWTRRYRVRIHGTPKDEDFAPLRQGITVEGVEYQPMEVEIDRQQGSNAWLTVTLREGKNREIRRVMEELGFTVNRLIRVSYGPFQLGDLPVGDVEEVRPRVVRDQLGLGQPAPVARTRRKAAAEDSPSLDDEPKDRPARDTLAARLPEGAVKRSLKPRAPKTRGTEDGEAAPRTRQARDARRDDPPSPFAKSRTWMRADDARGGRDEDAESKPRPERGPRSAGFRSQRDEGGEHQPRGRATGFKSHRSEDGDRPARHSGPRPSREGDDRPARAYKPRRDESGDQGDRARKPRWSSGDRGERPPRSEGGDRPARTWQPRREGDGDRAPRAYGPRPARDGDGDRPARAYKPRRDGDEGRPARPYKPRVAREGDEERPPRAYKPRGDGDRPARPYKPARPARAGGDDDRPPRSFKPRAPREEGGHERSPRAYKPRAASGDRPARSDGPRKGPAREGGFKGGRPGGKPPRRG